MNKWILAFSVFALGTFLLPHDAFAQGDSSIEQEELLSDRVKDNPDWVPALKSQHHLKDSQITMMKEQGLTYPQMAMVSRLSEKSGKPVDDIIKMRNADKMGWAEIANELGVAPKEIGRSVAALRHEVSLEKRIQRMEKREARMEKKETKRAERANRRNK